MKSMEQAVRDQFILDYAQNRGEFTLYDFGDGQTVMPMTDAVGSYLTKSVAFVVLRGEEKPTYDGPLPKEGKVLALGNGWFTTPVEIDYSFGTTDEVTKRFSEAEVLLLKARD